MEMSELTTCVHFSFLAAFPILRWLPLSSNKQFNEQQRSQKKVIQLMRELVDQHDDTEGNLTNKTVLTDFNNQLCSYSKLVFILKAWARN